MTRGQKAERFALKARLIIRGHLLCPLWWNRRRRHDFRQDIYAGVQSYIDRHYLPAANALAQSPAKAVTSHSPADSAGLTDSASSPKERLFTIWLQGADKAPDLVQACFRSQSSKINAVHTILDIKSLNDYIELPGIILDKFRRGRIGPAHFTDICRVELLHNHGGFWMDATCFATDDIPSRIRSEDFFAFMVGNVGDRYSFMQNCFLRSRKGNFLLEGWRAMILDYWKRENSRIDYFQHQLMFKSLVEGNAEARELFSRMPKVNQDPTHALWWQHREEAYTPERFKAVTSGSFFQKTTYKGAADPRPGTIKYEMLCKDTLI